MKAYFIVLLGVVGSSMSSIFVRCSNAPSLVLVVYRMAFAILLLLPSVWRRRQELACVTKRNWVLSALSGLALGLGFAASFEAVQNTTVAASSVLANMEVFFVALVTVLVFRQRLSKKAWAAVFITFAGAAVIAMADGTGAAGSNALWGDLMAVLAALLVAIYTMIGAVCRKSMGTTVYTWLVYFWAMLTAALLSVVSGVPLAGHGAQNYAMALGLTVFSTLLGHSVFSWGLKYLPATLVSTMKMLEPGFSSLWGLLLFSERPHVLVLLGGVVVISGVLLYSRAEAEKTEESV